MSVPSESQLVPGPDLAPVVAGLLRREGIGLLERRARLNGLLRDYAPNAMRDIRLLLTAYDAGTPARLQASGEPLAAAALAIETDRMVNEFGCAAPLARNAVETWARALVGFRAPLAQGHAVMPPRVATPTGIRGGPVPHEEQPGWLGRWGGIAVGILLVFIAITRWLGLWNADP